MNIEKLRKLAGREEIDYQFLQSALSDYSRPREKISLWLKSGSLVRVKKGLYVFGKEVARGPYSKEVLANLVYGPSAISLSSALAFYGLIPERTVVMTSITHKRNKSFLTPVGEFTYQYLHSNKYSVGIEWLKISKDKYILIASPEKSLCDHLHLTDKKIHLATFEEMESYLLHDLRIEKAALQSFRIKRFSEIAQAYGDARLDLLLQLLKRWKIR